MKELKQKAALCLIIAICFLAAAIIELVEVRHLSYPFMGIVGGFTSVGSCYLVKAKQEEKNSKDFDKEK